MHPFLFHIGGHAIPAYGVLVGLGFFIGLLVGGVRARRDGLPFDLAWDLGIIAMVAGIVGGRAEYVRTHLWRFSWDEPLKVFALGEGGLVFYGGLTLTLVCYAIYGRWKGLSFFALTDAMAPSVGLGHALGRVGCLLAGCCYGAPTDSWWQVTFPEGAVAPAGVARVPTQVHEIAFNLALFALLWLLPRRFVGQRLALLLLLYGIFRAWNETLRADDRGFVFDGLLSTGQATSIVLGVVAIAIAITQRNVRPASAPAP